MKTEKEKNDEVKRLYKQIIAIDITTVPVPYERYSFYDRRYIVDEQVFGLCYVNGTKYVTRKSLGLDGTRFITNLEKKGEVTKSDYLHSSYIADGGMRGSRVVVLIKTDTLLKLQDRLITYLSSIKNSDLDRVKRMFVAIDEDMVAKNIISESELRASEDAYYRRVQLLNELNTARRDAKYRTEFDELRQKADEPPTDELAVLVSKIQAMGWDVTLRLRPKLTDFPLESSLQQQKRIISAIDDLPQG